MSIVSTKIPFKGTGKEYIGDDISEIAVAVKVTFWTGSSFSLPIQHLDDWNALFASDHVFLRLMEHAKQI